MGKGQDKNLNKAKLREHLRTMLRHLRLLTETPGPGAEDCYVIGGEGSWADIDVSGMPPMHVEIPAESNLGPTLCIVSDGLQARELYLAEVAKDDRIGSYVGEAAINSALIEILRELHVAPSLIDDVLDEKISSSLKALRAAIDTHRVFVPVVNLHLEGMDSISVGKVIFHTQAETKRIYFEGLKRDSSAGNQSDPAPPESGEFDPHPMIYQMNLGRWPTIAEVTIEAEATRLPQLVDSEVDASINLLRCFTPLLFDAEQAAFIGLEGAVVSTMRPLVAVPPEIHSNLARVGFKMKYILDPVRTEFLRTSCEFDTLSGILAKVPGDRTPFEAALVTGIRWLGRSIVGSDLPERVLSLVTALERMFTAKSEENADLSDRLSRRLAHLIGTDQQKRIATFKRAKALYGLRSKVVHEGQTEVSVETVAELEMLACRALIGLARRTSEWVNHDEIIKWDQDATFM